MLNRDVSQPYIYSTVCVICGAVGFYLFDLCGALIGFASGMLVVLLSLIRRLRDV